MVDDPRAALDFRPVPDPTVLTTDQLRRELGMLRELIEARIEGDDKFVAERFAGIQKQFEERDIRTKLQVDAASTAVSAALQAQKEAAYQSQQSNDKAILKSEAGFSKEIGSLETLINATKESLTQTIGDLRSRLDRGEGGNTGAKEARQDAQMTIGTVLGIVGGIVGILTLIAAIMVGVIEGHSTVPTPTVVSPAVIPLQK
jgi:hypothetical protein